MKARGKLKGDVVVATVMSNLGFFRAMKSAEIAVEITPVGDRYVLEKMIAEDFSLGGEQSGHIIFLNHSTTGDGILASLQIANMMKEQRQSLSDLAKCMKKRPQIMINLKVKNKKPIESLKDTKKAIIDAEKKLGEKGRVLVRYSGTQNLARIMVEGDNDETINQLATQISEAMEGELNG